MRSDNKINQREGGIFKDKKQKVIDYIKKKIQIVNLGAASLGGKAPNGNS